ncbi:starch-binding protein [Anaerosporobacter sp.]|uniref:starch-binding protein n=1 Tax=Anaerosporobacter sp. TaxID=1872529 RepID=UPI00286F2A0C|nr:starch-binding protein [Anaerosporobacter sp.]
MKKKLEKVLSFVLVFAFVAMGFILPNKLVLAADATDSNAGDSIKIYYYNENGWDNVNIWSWTMQTTKDLAQNAWPGDAMTDVGDGWFCAEIVSDESIGVLFTNNSGAQTADCKDLAIGNTYWLTNGSEDLLNDSGMGGGVTVVASTEPKAGWPEGPAAEVATTAPASEDKNNVTLYICIGAAVVVVIIAVCMIITSKKKGSK